jgi:multisubunit Na+/H+ antiporter MnhB subunit
MRRAVAGGAVVLLAMLTGLGLARAWWQTTPAEAGLTALVEHNLERSGVEHGVTAVLLNFRAYDTWLELAVLLLALLGCLAVLQQRNVRSQSPQEEGGPVWQGLIRVLVPLMVLVAGYLLWLGKAAAGGAFQAGVVLGAAWVLVWLAGRRGLAALNATVWRLAAAVGLIGFLGAAFAGLIRSGEMLRYPEEHAGWIIVGLEVLAMISIAVALASLLMVPSTVPGGVVPGRAGTTGERKPRG